MTILRRRPGFRRAFANFDPAVLADYGERDINRLLADPQIIRNRAKIEAAISNARVTVQLTADDPGALDRLIWSFRPPAPRPESARPRTAAELPASTPESAALSAELRRRGYRFVGPVTSYALMQSAGLVDDHLRGCWRAAS